MPGYCGADRNTYISSSRQLLVPEIDSQGGNEMNEQSSGYASDAKHYQALSEQPIEIMQKLFSAEQLKGFLLGNVIKYSLRCGLKDNPAKEMQKVAQYAAWYVDVAEGRKIDPRGDKKCQILR